MPSTAVVHQGGFFVNGVVNQGILVVVVVVVLVIAVAVAAHVVVVGHKPFRTALFETPTTRP